MIVSLLSKIELTRMVGNKDLPLAAKIVEPPNYSKNPSYPLVSVTVMMSFFASFIVGVTFYLALKSLRRQS